MTGRRISVVAAVIAAVALVTIGLVSGAYRLVCPDSICATADAGRTTADPNGGNPGRPSGSPASTPSPPRGTPSAQPAAPTRHADRLEPGQRLLRGQTLTSADGRYTLTLQDSDGNLVIYEDGSTALWHVGPSPDAAFLINQVDGNLVLVRRDGSSIWATGTAGKAGLTLYIFDDGNLVLLDRDEKPVWETDTGSNR